MATIVQLPLFSWDAVDSSPEILRLKRVLDVLPDADLIKILLQERKGKRNDYPLEAVWNSLIAGIVFGHGSIESLRRELLRNAELREICGFDPLLGDEAVPSKFAYSRFLGKLCVFLLGRTRELCREWRNRAVRRAVREPGGRGHRENLAISQHPHRIFPLTRRWGKPNNVH